MVKLNIHIFDTCAVAECGLKLAMLLECLVANKYQLKINKEKVSVSQHFNI